MPNKDLQYLGFDLSTTKLSVCGRTPEGEEVFTSLAMRGATTWRGEPAFNLSELPGMFEEILGELQNQGYGFVPRGALSFSVRQHDMVLIGLDGQPLIPALSWQCNAATGQVKYLQQIGAESEVGKVEERFILPKLMWVLDQEPNLGKKITLVMTTGDYIAWQLTGRVRLSTSDALSNALLRQESKTLAREVISLAGLNPNWFPPLIQSGRVVERVNPPLLYPWRKVINTLLGWKVIAPLGDNHSSAVGCGLADFQTLIVSLGSSGTVVRMVDPRTQLAGEAACFEYFDHRLLLMMVKDCATRYNRFVQEFGEGKTLEKLDALALEACPAKIIDLGAEGYSQGWNSLTLGEKVASLQSTLASELYELVLKMLAEVRDEDVLPIIRIVLTGGLSQSSFFRRVFRACFPPSAKLQIFVSAQEGPSAFQAATRGAMINAMVGAKVYSDLSTAVAVLCPLKQIQ